MPQIVSTVVPVVAALAGIGLGWWLRARSEQQQWLQQQRLETYAAVLGDADQVFKAALELFYTLKGNAVANERRIALRDAWFTLNHSGNRLRLVGAPGTQEAGRALIAHCVSMLFRIAATLAGLPEGEKEWEKAADRYVDLADAFTDAASADLRLVRGRGLTKKENASG